MIELRELAEVLAARGRLHCAPTVEGPDERSGREGFTLHVRVDYHAQDKVRHGVRPGEVTGLLHEVQYLCDIATLRALCERHDIPMDKLEAMLPPKE